MSLVKYRFPLLSFPILFLLKSPRPFGLQRFPSVWILLIAHSQYSSTCPSYHISCKLTAESRDLIGPFCKIQAVVCFFHQMTHNVQFLFIVNSISCSMPRFINLIGGHNMVIFQSCHFTSLAEIILKEESSTHLLCCYPVLQFIQENLDSFLLFPQFSR